MTKREIDKIMDDIMASMVELSREDRLDIIYKLLAVYCEDCGGPDGYDCYCKRDD